MNRKFDCLGLGIAPADLLMGIDKYPDPGQKVDATQMVMQGGGPVPTAMVALSRLGMKSAMLAVVGDDPFGQFVIDELEKEKVDSSLIIKKMQPTAVASGWFEKESGRRTIVLELKIELNARDIDFSKFPVVRSIHLDGRYLEASLKLAQWARKNRVTVVLDVGSMRNDISPLLPYVDHLVAADAFARPYTKENEIRNAVHKLQELIEGTVVVTCGTEGSYGIEEGNIVYQKACKVATVDTTGAGDAYHGGYIYGLLNEFNLAERMKFASAVAAINCTGAGGRAALPDLEKVTRFMKNGNRYHA